MEPILQYTQVMVILTKQFEQYDLAPRMRKFPALGNKQLFEASVQRKIETESPEDFQLVDSQPSITDELSTYGERFVYLYLKRERSFHNTRRFIVDYLKRLAKPVSEFPPGSINPAQSHMLDAIADDNFNFVNYASMYNLAGKQDAEQLFRQSLQLVFDLQSNA